MAEDHDSSYRLLFSHARMVADLLRGFVRVPWVERLDPGSLEKRSEISIGDRLDRREEDLVWRLGGDGGWAYVYILLEFQSRVDRHMALRMLTYVGLLYQDLLRRGEVTRSGLLPPVLPVVLYNGTARWTAPLEVSSLVQPVRGLARHRPRFECLLLDERRVRVPSGDNLAALLFELERCRTPEAIERVVGHLVCVLASPEQAGLRRAFTTFLRESLLPARFPEAQVEAVRDLEEVRPMLKETVKGWTREWQRQGLEKGLKQGLQKGVRQGEAALLARLLERKFGPLSAHTRRRIDRADAETLLTWGERVLTAGSLAEVFGD